MSNGTQTLPVRQWYLRLERVHDEAAARDAWRSAVVAQGWSPVGEPEIIRDGDFVIVGRLIQHPGLTINPDLRDALVLPA